MTSKITEQEKSEFTSKDREGISALSYLQNQVDSVKEQPSQLCQKIYDQMQFSLVRQGDAPSLRIMQKDTVPKQLEVLNDSMRELAIQTRIGKEIKPVAFKSRNQELIKKTLLHLASAFEQQPDDKKPTAVNNQNNSNSSNKPPHALMQKLGFDNSKQTGTSIASGNYMNLNVANLKQQQAQVPTWKQMENNGNMNNNQFSQFNMNNQLNKQRPPTEGGYQPPQSVNDMFANGKKQFNNNNNNTHNSYYDQQFGQQNNNNYLNNMNNMNNMNNGNNKLQKFIDMAGGQDLDHDKVRRQMMKESLNNPADIPNQGPKKQDANNGFVTGLQQYQENAVKNKNQHDYYNNQQDYNYKQKQIEDYQNARQRNYGQQRYDSPQQMHQWQNGESASDKLFNNRGRQTGLGGARRKFVPPTREDTRQNNGGSHGGGGGFNPGQSVKQHVLAKGMNQQEEKDKNGLENQPAFMDDERYKNLDPHMVEVIEGEIMEKQCNITWDDIAGLEFAKKIIQEIIIWPMLRPDIFTGIRAPPRGVMFFGPPGTGKTLLGKAIAAQSKSTFLSISASTLTSKWVGEGEKMVRTMFAIAAIHQPSVVFIDEIDSLLSARNDQDQEGSRRIKTEFLVQLDGANTFAGDEARILIIGATNRPDDLDEAVRRRLVKKLYIPLPNSAGRKQFLERLVKTDTNKHIDLNGKSLDELTKLSIGYSGADLKCLSTEAAMIPLRSISDIANVDITNIRATNISDFKEALKLVRPSVNRDDLQKFLDWNDKFGSFPISQADLAD